MVFLESIQGLFDYEEFFSDILLQTLLLSLTFRGPEIIRFQTILHVPVLAPMLYGVKLLHFWVFRC